MKRTTAFLLLCGVGGLAIFSSTIAKNPVLPILAQQIGADKATIGLIAAASTVTGVRESEEQFENWLVAPEKPAVDASPGHALVKFGQITRYNTVSGY